MQVELLDNGIRLTASEENLQYLASLNNIQRAGVHIVTEFLNDTLGDGFQVTTYSAFPMIVHKKKYYEYEDYLTTSPLTDILDNGYTIFREVY